MLFIGHTDNGAVQGLAVHRLSLSPTLGFVSGEVPAGTVVAARHGRAKALPGRILPGSHIGPMALMAVEAH